MGMIIFIFKLFFIKSIILAESIPQKNNFCIHFSEKNCKGMNLYQIVDYFSDNLTESVKKTLPVFEFPTDYTAYNFDNKTKFKRAAYTIVLDKGFDAYSEALGLHMSFIIFYTQNLNDIKGFVSVLVDRLTGNHPRPKCLVILMNQSRLSDISVDHVLRYVWNEKFLDFSIMSVGEESVVNTSPIIYYYNPFLNFISKQSFNQTIPIFPDKMKNLNKYAIRLLNDANVKDQVLIPQKNGKVRSHGSDTLLLEFALKYVGFSLQYRRLSQKDYQEEVMGSKILMNLPFAISVPTETTAQTSVALVPNTLSHEINIPLMNIFLATAATCVVYAFVKVLEYFKITTEFTKLYYVTLILLGQSVSPEPKKVLNRILFLLLTLLYVWTSNELYSNIVEVQYGNDDSSLNSLEDLNKSGIPMFASPTHIFSLFVHSNSKTNDSELLKSLVYRTKPLTGIDPDYDCVQELMKTKSMACLMSDVDAESFISMYRNPDGTDQIKIVKPPLFEDFYFYIFISASPYAEKFAKVIRKINEAGLTTMIAMLNDPPVKMRIIIDVESFTKETTTDIIQPLLIFCAGHLVATFVFFSELIFKYFSKIKRQIRIQIFPRFKKTDISRVVNTLQLIYGRFFKRK